MSCRFESLLCAPPAPTAAAGEVQRQARRASKNPILHIRISIRVGPSHVVNWRPVKTTNYITRIQTPLNIAPKCCLVVAVGLSISACQTQPTTTEAADPAGVYALVSVNGKPVPASVAHQGATLQVRSGAFTINADGTCVSKIILVPPSGTEATREVRATYTKDGSKLTMQWKGAGKTVGTIDGNTFTMENEGMALVYRK